MTHTLASSLLASFSLLAVGCMTSPDDGVTGTADVKREGLVGVTPEARCGDGEQVGVTAEPNIVGNIVAVDAMINCGADGVEVCWDGQLSDGLGGGQANLVVRRTGDRTARCGETRRLYIDVSDISATFVDTKGSAGTAVVAFSRESYAFYTADIYGGVDHEYFASVGAMANAPDLVMGELPEGSDLSMANIVRALDLSVPSDVPLSRFVTLFDADAAFAFLADRGQAEASMAADLADFVYGRLTQIGLVKYKSGISTDVFVVGKTADGQVAGFKFYGVQ